MFYRWNFEHEERFTVRQMIAHITYSFTGNLNCAGIKELKGKRDLKRKLYNSYSNLFFGYHYEKEFSKADKNALQIKPIRLLQQQKLDAKKPVIMMGEHFSGFRKYDSSKNIYRVDIGGIDARQVYINGVRGIRARSEGYHGLTNVTNEKEYE